VEPISSPPLDAPTIAVTISPNTSPINGKDGGKNLTAAVIRTRLMRETENNVAVQVFPSPHEVHTGFALELIHHFDSHLLVRHEPWYSFALCIYFCW
jgi:hypothetical protein